MSIGERLKSLRKDKRLTQKKLGELSGIDEANIRKYELGSQNPKLETLTKIANGLGVPITDLISESGISLRKENAALEGLKSILECIYNDVEFNWHVVIDRDGIPEYDGDYDVFINGEKIHLTKKEFEILFDFVCQNIPVFIKTIINNRP